jgi:hypothetical protein
MRWQSTAHKQPTTQRERFSRPVAVIGVFVSFLFVLALLYPEQGLMGVLSAGGEDAPATIRYREALLRIHPDDMELRLKVAGSLLRNQRPERVLELFAAIKTVPSASQLQMINEQRYKALLALLGSAKPGSLEWLDLRRRQADAALKWGGTNPAAWRLRQFAEDSRQAGDFDSWRLYSARAEAKEKVDKGGYGDDAGQALMAGDYRRASALCFALMKKASAISERRAYFVRGVRALQAGNLPQEAFAAGERHLDGLAHDRETLIFMTRAALAAGQPQRAQTYVRRALGMENGRQAGAP